MPDETSFQMQRSHGERVYAFSETVLRENGPYRGSTHRQNFVDVVFVSAYPPRPDAVIPALALGARYLAPWDAERGDHRLGYVLILVREEKPVVWMIEAPPVAARVRILKALFPQERRYD